MEPGLPAAVLASSAGDRIRVTLPATGATNERVLGTAGVAGAAVATAVCMVAGAVWESCERTMYTAMPRPMAAPKMTRREDEGARRVRVEAGWPANLAMSRLRKPHRHSSNRVGTRRPQDGQFHEKCSACDGFID
jgi:hypothetical protein